MKETGAPWSSHLLCTISSSAHREARLCSQSIGVPSPVHHPSMAPGPGNFPPPPPLPGTQQVRAEEFSTSHVQHLGQLRTRGGDRAQPGSDQSLTSFSRVCSPPGAARSYTRLFSAYTRLFSVYTRLCAEWRRRGRSAVGGSQDLTTYKLQVAGIWERLVKGGGRRGSN